MLWNVLMAIFPLVLTQNQQWQVIEKNALNHFIPGVTKSQVKSIASCKGLTAAANLCLTMANGNFRTYNATNGAKDCKNYLSHRFSLQRYVDFFFARVAQKYLSIYKAAELKSDFWQIDKRSKNMLNTTYCTFLETTSNKLLGINRAKFFEHSMNISQEFRSKSLDDYCNVFFFREVGQANYAIADAADNCLYSFGHKWGFGVYASQYAK